MIPLRDTLPSHSTPVVTIGLIVANVLVFLYEMSLDAYTLNEFVYAYGMVPDRFAWSAVLTSMFLHGGWMHLIGNMWFLWIYGDNVEDILGKARYLVFYLLSGAAAVLVQVAIQSDSRIPIIGASGAIAGVMGAYMVKFPHARILTLIPIFFIVTFQEIPAFLILVYWFVIQFFSGVGAIASAHQGGGVAWFAHIGGFLAGMALIQFMRTRERYRRRYDLHW
jgi:membrane associated rhomboid family serine protease